MDENRLIWTAPTQTFVHRQQCAAITNGCTSALIWESTSPGIDERFLRINGWRLDYGHWVCDRHGE